MPEKKTLASAARAKREGKSPSTQAGPFVHEEIEHLREGKHGARSTKQAIAIGLSKARRAGVELPPPKHGSAAVKRAAKRDSAKVGKTRPSPRRSRASKRVLEREPTRAASSAALSRQAHAASERRSKSERSAAARRAARTKGSAGRKAAARKAARSRASHARA